MSMVSPSYCQDLTWIGVRKSTIIHLIHTMVACSLQTSSILTLPCLCIPRIVITLRSQYPGLGRYSQPGCNKDRNLQVSQWLNLAIVPLDQFQRHPRSLLCFILQILLSRLPWFSTWTISLVAPKTLRISSLFYVIISFRELNAQGSCYHSRSFDCLLRCSIFFLFYG